MRYISFFIRLLLQVSCFTLCYTATTPAENTLSTIYPNTNQSLAHKLLQTLNSNPPHHIFQDPTLRTTQPWPPAPFNFRSREEPDWLLRVTSYEPRPRLTYRQLHALLSLCADAEDQIKTKGRNDPMELRTHIFRATAQEPYDLSRENVEVAVFNSADEPGAAYKAEDMYIALDIILERILPHQLVDMTRTVAHYSEFEPRKGALLKFRKVVIRRKTTDSSGRGDGPAVTA
ncbi:MAG: hypothetical protein Q9182_002835 [Xanthomendoza sp. 2 TL-2023]